MAKKSSGIDYSKWDHFEDSDDEEEEEQTTKPPSTATTTTTQKSRPVPIFAAASRSGAAGAAAGAASTGQSSSSSLSPPPFDMSNLKIGQVVPMADVKKHQASVAASGGIDSLVLDDPSKVFHTEDGKLIVDDGDGKKFMLKHAFDTNGGQFPSMTERLGATTCYHGSTKENFDEGKPEECVKELLRMMHPDILNQTPIAPGEGSTFNRNIRVLAEGKKYQKLFDGTDGFGVTLSQHAFAHAAKLFLEKDDSIPYYYDKHPKLVLLMAIFIHYVHTPGCQGDDISAASANGRRCMKYHQLVGSGETGGIRCLAKHLPCDCFKKLKAATCVGKQVAYCEGCCQDLLVEKLKHCGRCKKVSYCSRECQTDDWQSHKKFCKKIAKGNK